MADPIVALEFEKPIAELESKIEELSSCAASEHMDFSKEILTLEEKCEQLKRQIYGGAHPLAARFDRPASSASLYPRLL